MPTQTANPLVSFIMPMLFIFFIFYFVLIRPQKKMEKQHRDMLNNLKKNDEVVTIGGVHGVIVNVKDKTFVVRIDENVKMEIDKSAVARVIKQENTENKP
ncbi:MAG: preprotein translocase subunit YajC [Candidatus Omnitrophota bacterium]